MAEHGTTMRTTSRPADLPLTLTSPAEPEPVVHDPAPSLPWWLMALLGGWGVVLLGWTAVGVLVGGAWLSATWLPAETVLQTVGRGWLGLHGVGVELGGAEVRLAPLGLTLLVAIALAVVAHQAGGPAADDAGDAASGWRRVGVLVGAVSASYASGVLVVASLIGSPAQVGQAFASACVLGAAGSLAGATVGRPELMGPLPAWARALPVAIGVGCAALTITSAAALAVAVALRWERVSALQASLDPDGPGVWLLAALTVVYGPTILLWAGSWLLGAGFSVGGGTVVAPGTSLLGLLPAVPVLGAVPTAATPGDWAALLAGLAAGATAGWWWWREVTRTSAAPSLLRAAWQGGLAGLGVALAWVAASWLARGALGSERLAVVGPRFPELLAWAPTILVLGAAAASAGTAAYQGRRRR